MNIIDEDDGPLVSRYKAEQLEGGAFADVEEARMETFIYIESYYNRVRRHSALGYQSPEDFEQAYYQRSEGADVESYDLEEVQGIYRWVSQTAFCFIIEFNGQPIGECWLQRMNIGRLLEKYPGKDCRRIDLMIGEKRLWGRGLGTDTIRTLTRFGLEEESSAPSRERDTKLMVNLRCAGTQGRTGVAQEEIRRKREIPVKAIHRKDTNISASAR